MRTIYLIRHGQCVDNALRILNGHRDTELTELGRKQAKASAKKLKNKKITVIYSSPLKRALETAEIIADEIGVDLIKLDKDLIERDFGKLTGQLIADIPNLATQTCPINGICYFLDGPGVETFPKLYSRVKRALKKILKQNSDGNIAIVTHGDTGMMLQAAFYDWDWERGIKYRFWKNAEIFELKEYKHDD
ncbi:MAG: histidine phosphatase family protein [Patescibacteria group bacterium]|nr:histidine phosphatase family protein [Patescibacteria group bacterium]